ncbi:MAG: hypothetical protein ACK59A_01665 [Cyanobacteriota bacterium]
MPHPFRLLTGQIKQQLQNREQVLLVMGGVAYLAALVFRLARLRHLPPSPHTTGRGTLSTAAYKR